MRRYLGWVVATVLIVSKPTAEAVSAETFDHVEARQQDTLQPNDNKESPHYQAINERIGLLRGMATTAPNSATGNSGDEKHGAVVLNVDVPCPDHSSGDNKLMSRRVEAYVGAGVAASNSVVNNIVPWNALMQGDLHSEGPETGKHSEGEQPVGPISESPVGGEEGEIETTVVNHVHAWWDQDDCDPCEVPTQVPTFAAMYPHNDEEHLPTVIDEYTSWDNLKESAPTDKPTKAPDEDEGEINFDNGQHCTKVTTEMGEGYECESPEGIVYCKKVVTEYGESYECEEGTAPPPAKTGAPTKKPTKNSDKEKDEIDYDNGQVHCTKVTTEDGKGYECESPEGIVYCKKVVTEYGESYDCEEGTAPQSAKTDAPRDKPTEAPDEEEDEIDYDDGQIQCSKVTTEDGKGYECESPEGIVYCTKVTTAYGESYECEEGTAPPPSDTTAPPTDTTASPVHSTPAPEITTAPPGDTTAPPTTPPVDSTPTPENTTAPPAGTTTPPGDTTAPAKTPAPPADTTAPPAGTTAPPTHTTAPPGDTTAPVKTPAPTAGTTAPPTDSTLKPYAPTPAPTKEDESTPAPTSPYDEPPSCPSGQQSIDVAGWDHGGCVTSGNVCVANTHGACPSGAHCAWLDTGVYGCTDGTSCAINEQTIGVVGWDHDGCIDSDNVCMDHVKNGDCPGGTYCALVATGVYGCVANSTPAPTKPYNEPTPTPAATTPDGDTAYATSTIKPGTSTGTATTGGTTTTASTGTSTGDTAYANAATSDGTTAKTGSSGAALGPGATAGIVIGCAVFVAIVVGAVLFKQKSLALQREANLFADLSDTGGATDYAAM